MYILSLTLGTIKNKTPRRVKSAVSATLTQSARAVLTGRFGLEYELYNFLKQRLRRQAEDLDIS